MNLAADQLDLTTFARRDGIATLSCPGAAVTLSRILVACPLAICVLVSGCTTIEISGAERVVQHRFGVLSVVPDGKADALVIHVRGAGLVPGVTGATLGYASETAAYFYDPTQCRVVLFTETRVEVDAFLDARGISPAEICDVRRKDTP